MLILPLILKFHRNPRTRKALWRHMYQFWMGSYHQTDWTFSNHGYSSLRSGGATYLSFLSQTPNMTSPA